MTISELLPDRSALETAADFVHRLVPPSPQICWPLLCERVGAEMWVKHENHNPTGAFKVRGGLVYMDGLVRRDPGIAGVIAATRGNHGQSVAFAAARNGLRATICIPHGNSVEKNAAMRAYGAELIEHGNDFQAALEHARGLADRLGLHFMPSYDRDLVRGVASYAMELFAAQPDLDTVYVPIGLGSGICAVIAARDALGRRAKVVGVVAENAAAYALSFEAGRPVATNSADTMADGMACRVPVAEVIDILLARADRIVTVSDAEIEDAMRALYTDTHNVAEGAGAAALAAAIQERGRIAGRPVAVVLSGGNVDREVYARVLSAA